MSHPFFNSFSIFLQKLEANNHPYTANNNGIIAIHEKKLVIALCPLGMNHEQLKNLLKNDFDGYKKIMIHEKIWIDKKTIIESRVKQLLGLNQKIAGRKCSIQKLDQTVAGEFLNNNHLLGNCKAAYKYGLLLENNLVAVATFSKSRVMTDSKVYYRSYELLRFAVQNGYSVTGGLSKLLQHFIQEKKVVHLMTYIDNEWGIGEAFVKFGFKKSPDKLVYPQATEIFPTTNASSKLILDLRGNDAK